MSNRPAGRTLVFAVTVGLILTVIIFAYRTNSVAGRVIDAETGVPLAGSRVKIADGSVLLTDAAGSFSLDSRRGIVPLQIEAPAYHSLTTMCDASIFTLGEIACRYELQPQELTVHVSDAMDSSIVIADAIVYADGLPLEHAGVDLYVGKRFVPPVEITVTAAGYHPWKGLGSNERAVDIRLRPTRLSGIVRASDTGEPLSDVHIEVIDLSTRTDRGGFFEFLRLPGPVQIRARLEGFHDYYGNLIDKETILAGQAIDPHMNPNFTPGMVSDMHTARPIAGATISSNDQTVTADENGAFQLRALRQNTAVVIEASDYFSAAMHYANDSFLDIPLQSSLAEIIVRDSRTGRPLEAAAIETKLGRILSDAEGHGTISGLHPGELITILATHYYSHTFIYAGEPMVDVPLTQMRVEVTVRDTRTGEPVHAAVASVLGTVLTDAEGRVVILGLRRGEQITIQATNYFSHPLQYAGSSSLDISLKQIRAEVVVTDALTMQPIEGAIVETHNEAIFTDADGHCVVLGLLPGQPITIRLVNHETEQMVFAGEDPLMVVLRPLQVALTIADAGSGGAIPGLRLTENDVELLPVSEGSYVITDWRPERVFALRAAGYRKHEFSIDQAGFDANQDPTMPSLSLSDQTTGQGPAVKLDVPAFIVKGIYIPFGLLTRPDIVGELLELVKETELNAIVIDMKGDRGFLAYPSETTLATELGIDRRDVMDIKELLRECEEAGIYTIARQVVFKDHPLATAKSEWASVTAEGVVWLDREGLGWTNPFLQEVRDYNIALATEIAALGFDEIQFDYVRFPSDGDVKQIVYEEESTLETRSAAITMFVEQVAAALRPYGIFTSVDVFGLTVWVTPDHDMGIGQRVKDIAPFIDYLCPMVYPSTFSAGSFGYESPEEYPYEVIYRSVIQAGTRVPATTRIRPWLQAYWYTLDEQLVQKEAATDSNASGWCFWNARGSYGSGLFQMEDGQQ